MSLQPRAEKPVSRPRKSKIATPSHSASRADHAAILETAMPLHTVASRILESITDAFVALDVNWRYTYLNAKAAQIFGHRPEELVGKHIWTEFPEGVGQPFYHAYHRALATQTPFHFDDYYAPYDRWFENHIYPSPEGLAIFFQDITARKKAEIALQQTAVSLQETEQWLRLALESGQLGSYQIDIPTMQYVTVTDTFKAHYGYPPDASLTYAAVLAMMHPADLPQVQSALHAALMTRKAYEFEHRCRWPDGTEHWVFVQGIPIYDTAGTPQRMFGVTREITAQKTAEQEREAIEEALRESEERQRLATEGGRVGTWHWDVHSGVIQVSEHMQSLLDMSGTETITFDSFMNVIHTDDRNRVQQSIAKSLMTVSDNDLEFRVVWPDSSVHWIASKGRVYVDSGGFPLRMEGIGLDVTSRKLAEAEAERALLREQRIADTLQRSILQMPASDAFPGLQVETLYEPVLEDADVGGDFIDAFHLPDGRIAFVVGDVSGKGLEAAAQTMEVKYVLRALLRENPKAVDTLTRLNALLCESYKLDETLSSETQSFKGFICLALLLIDVRSGEVVVSTAGSEPPLIVRSYGRAEEILLHAMPLGVDAEAEYQQWQGCLGPGDVVAFVTDGITEARSGKHFFGYDRVVQTITEETQRGALSDVARKLVHSARGFADGALRDDVTVLLVRRL